MKNEVEYVNEDYATPYGKLASDNSTDYRLDRGEKEGVHFKEHVVGVDPREIDQVGYYRHKQRGMAGRRRSIGLRARLKEWYPDISITSAQKTIAPWYRNVLIPAKEMQE